MIYCSVASCDDNPTGILTPINLKGVIITIPLCLRHSGRNYAAQEQLQTINNSE